MATDVLLSIKPEFAEKIFTGSKQYEFRKKVFRRAEVTRIIVYASAPVSRVIGEFEIAEILQLQKDELWERTKARAGISKVYFDSYFADQTAGYAIRVGAVHRYTPALQLLPDFNVRYPPQSFMYLHDVVCHRFRQLEMLLPSPA